MADVELVVGEIEPCTCVTYIAYVWIIDDENDRLLIGHVYISFFLDIYVSKFVSSLESSSVVDAH